MARSPCLNYHLRQCLAPCAGKIDGAAYAGIVSELRIFLEKGRPGLIKALTEKMLEESKNERFEEAAKIRLRIEALSSMKEKSVRYIPADETEELRSMLGLQAPVEAIAAFDVSNIMGQEAVGSMIYFFRGRPRKSEYRKFRIRSVSGVDDYSMMREIVRRRYGRLLEEKKRLPDLIVIDGGKGHLAAALGELEALGIAGIPAIGIAKQFEHIYMKDRKDPLILPRDSKALHLLERIRDEAHRFAITYHKGLRSKKIGLSELDDIRGIGPKRKKALIERFGSVDRIKAASLEELLKAGGIDGKSAKNIFDHFRK
jgi:excinuclease ABC subunit C